MTMAFGSLSEQPNLIFIASVQYFASGISGERGGKEKFFIHMRFSVLLGTVVI